MSGSLMSYLVSCYNRRVCQGPGSSATLLSRFSPPPMTTTLSTIQPSPPSSVDGSSLERSPDRIEALFTGVVDNPVQRWLASPQGNEVRVVIKWSITNELHS